MSAGSRIGSRRNRSNIPLAGPHGTAAISVGIWERMPMNLVLNGLYLLAAAVMSPWLLYKAATTGKYRRGLWAKVTGDAPKLPARRRVWFHGVSVGEIHLLRQLIAAFRRRLPDCDCVISTTTDTGLAEARKHFPD